MTRLPFVDQQPVDHIVSEVEGLREEGDDHHAQTVHPIHRRETACSELYAVSSGSQLFLGLIFDLPSGTTWAAILCTSTLTLLGAVPPRGAGVPPHPRCRAALPSTRSRAGRAGHRFQPSCHTPHLRRRCGCAAKSRGRHDVMLPIEHGERAPAIAFFASGSPVGRKSKCG